MLGISRRGLKANYVVQFAGLSNLQLNLKKRIEGLCHPDAIYVTSVSPENLKKRIEGFVLLTK